MTVESFKSVDAMLAYMAGATEKANSQMKPWQRKVTYGDYFVIYHDRRADAPITYGYIPTIQQFSNEDPFNENRTFVFAKLYNSFEMQGEYESIHICHFDAILTAQQFKQLKAAHWPDTMPDMLSVMYGTKNKPLVFLVTRKGSPQLSRSNHRLVYCLLTRAGLDMMDEAELTERFGLMGCQFNGDWTIDDKGNGGVLTWDYHAFEDSRS